MSKPNEDPNFRYPNDNRESSPGQYDYPSQQKNDPSLQKGEKGYYGNDNKGDFANSNRPSLSTVDPADKIQPPNSNYKPQ